MKKHLLLFFILTFILSCSSDSEDLASIKTSDIMTGTWKVSKKGKIYTDGEEEITKYYNPDCTEIWNINKDGTLIIDYYKANDSNQCTLYNSNNDRNWIEFEDGQISFYWKDIDPYDSFNDSRPIITFKENNEVMRIKIHISHDSSIKYEFTDFTRQN